MITETTYTPFDLESGQCKSCGEQSEEILIDDGRCVDCVEDQKFYEMTMQGLDD